MAGTYVSADEGIDSIKSLRAALADVESLRKSISKAAKKGIVVDAAKATEIVSELLLHAMDDIAILSQGDDDDRSQLCKRIAAAIIDEASDWR